MAATKKYSKKDFGEASTTECPLCVYATDEIFYENKIS